MKLKLNNTVITEKHENSTEWVDYDFIENIIVKYDVAYYMLYGERSNGKTYGAIEQALKARLKNPTSKSAYIRRYDENIRPKHLAPKDPKDGLITSHNIEYYTNGEYNYIKYISNVFYFAHRNIDGVIDKIDDYPFLYVFSINTWEGDKGIDRGFFDYIILDEFISKNGYLQDEVVNFLNVVSSLVRTRTGTKIIMLANTINKYCPYFKELGLTNAKRMRQGTVEIYNYNNDKTTVAIEYLDSVEKTNYNKKIVNNKYFKFDNPKLRMITGGEWEESEYPLIPKGLSKCKEMERLDFAFLDFDDDYLRIELWSGYYQFEYCEFITLTVCDDIRYADKIVISDKIKPSIRYWNRFDGDNKVLKYIRRCMLRDKVFYQNNAVGEIFSNATKVLSW